MITTHSRILTVITLLAGATQLLGQAPVPASWQWDATAELGYRGAAAVRGTGVDVDGTFHQAELSGSGVVGRLWRVGVGLSAARGDVGFSGPVDFGPAIGQPYASTREFGVSVSGFRRVDDRWTVGALGSVAWARAEGATGLLAPRWSDAATHSLAVVARYNWSPRVSLSLGMLYASALEDDALLIPILGLRYRHSDALTLRLLDAAGGGGLDIIAVDYQPGAGSPLSYALAVQWASGEYRLGTLSDGSGDRLAVADDAVRLAASATWQAGAGLTVRPFVAYDVRRELEFLANQVTRAEYRVGRAWMVGVQVGLGF
jgi:hypothetical protein